MNYTDVLRFIIFCGVFLSVHFANTIQGYFTGTGYRTIAPVSVKEPWKIRVNVSRPPTNADNVTMTKQNSTKLWANFMGYTVYV